MTLTVLFMSHDATQQACKPIDDKHFKPGYRVLNQPKVPNLSTKKDEKSRKQHEVNSSDNDYLINEWIDKGDNPDWGYHRMAVIVPYRDRLEELLEFAPYIHSYFVKKKVRHRIYVINQVDSLRFVPSFHSNSQILDLLSS